MDLNCHRERIPCPAKAGVRGASTVNHRTLHLFLVGILLSCFCGCTVVRTSFHALKSTDHFLPLGADSRVLYEPGAEDFAEQLAESLPQAVELVEAGQYRSFAKPVEIYVCASQESYTSLTGLKAPASLTLRGVFFSPRLVEEQRPVPLYLTHELSHLHLEQQMGKYRFAKLPAWFKEGLATLVSGGGGAHTVTDREAMEAIASGSHFVPHEHGGIFFRKYASHWGLTHHMFYRQSMVFVAYLKSRNENKYRNLLLSIQNGSSFADAFDDAYGVRVSQIWEQFLEETKQNTTAQQAFPFIKTVAPQAAEFAVHRLRPEADHRTGYVSCQQR